MFTSNEASKQLAIPPSSPPLAPCLVPGRMECGLDEAGRGPLAGPVVAAAVVLPAGYFNPLLNDSKKLTPAQRSALRETLLRDAAAWGLGVISVAQIDEINILQASFAAMRQALDMLLQRLPAPPCHLLVDGNRFPAHPSLPHTCVVGGDAKLMPIAAASILAKTFRDDIMDMLHDDHPMYGWAHNRGYPTRLHRAAIAQHGPTPHHRRSFRLLPPPMLLLHGAV